MKTTASITLLLLAATELAAGFAPVAILRRTTTTGIQQQQRLYMAGEEDASTDESATGAFVPLDAPPAEEDTFDKVEAFGRGSAKAKRGKRKGSSAPGSGTTTATPKTTLAAEETFYEGPPAITETIAPTISILTVVGIIPAAAAWARQAWVRYTITNRRIRVTSGIGGNDMAEIVYPDIVEIRTARRLFGDGDMVAFLRDGAKFEMRNIPDFEEAMEFILEQVDDDVAAEYRNKGEVTTQM